MQAVSMLIGACIAVAVWPGGAGECRAQAEAAPAGARVMELRDGQWSTISPGTEAYYQCAIAGRCHADGGRLVPSMCGAFLVEQRLENGDVLARQLDVLRPGVYREGPRYTIAGLATNVLTNQVVSLQTAIAGVDEISSAGGGKMALAHLRVVQSPALEEYLGMGKGPGGRGGETVDVAVSARHLLPPEHAFTGPSVSVPVSDDPRAQRKHRLDAERADAARRAFNDSIAAAKARRLGIPPAEEGGQPVSSSAP